MVLEAALDELKHLAEADNGGLIFNFDPSHETEALILEALAIHSAVILKQINEGNIKAHKRTFGEAQEAIDSGNFLIFSMTEILYKTVRRGGYDMQFAEFIKDAMLRAKFAIDKE